MCCSRFEDLLSLCQQYTPAMLLMTSFILISGSTAIPSLCSWPMKLVVAHLVPAQARFLAFHGSPQCSPPRAVLAGL